MASKTLSFTTTPDFAEKIAAAAASEGVSVSSVLESIVRRAMKAAPDVDGSVARRGPSQGEGGKKSSRRRVQSRPTSLLETAADAPEAVTKVLKSYDPKALRWKVRGHRYEIVVAILTRGNDQARRWLWTVLSLDEVRDLVRKYHGAGCAEPDRGRLRQQLGLTQQEIPSRPYLGLGERQSK